jgi:F-type H+-transporting ATPase subunit b
MNLIDVRQVITQILGFLLMLAILRRYAWGPVLGMLEARRAKITGEFEEADRRKAEADAARAKYEQELRGIEAQARVKLTEAVAEGQKVAAEIKTQANHDASDRFQRAVEDIARERERAEVLLREHVIVLSLRTAEKLLRQKLDDASHRKLVGEFIDEVGKRR